MNGLESIAQTCEQFGFPKKITFEVCSECNLECSMCYQPTMKRAMGVMPFDLWKKCADEIAAVSCDTECWFSFCGEPLLQPDLMCRILDYGGIVGLDSLNLNTNGVLLEPAVADRILDTPVDVVVFGVDGYSAAVYEKIRVGGDRELLYRNILYLLERRSHLNDGPEIQVQFIEMEENTHEFEAFRDYWLSHGATVKHRRKLSWGGRFETPLEVPIHKRIPCPWAITLMHVFWDGRVPRCPGDTEGEHCVGNVWSDPLSDLWGRLAAYRQLHLDRRFDDLPQACQECKDWMTGASERDRPAPPTANSIDRETPRE
jgi:sulfatase maturation enzyme AslB (radical SAM superfamily)